MNPSRSSQTPPNASIVIPVHNQLQFTQQCLASLNSTLTAGLFEVIVVDDASTDGTGDALQALACTYDWLRHVSTPINRGFAASCNRGAELAQFPYLLFLNNDTVATTPDWVAPLVEVLENRPDIGIVFPKLIFPDGSIQHCGKIWREHQLPRSHPDHIYYREPGDAPHVNRSRDYEMATGACLLLRTEEFFRYGPFDEQYENGWEDDDLCYAYRAQGMRIHYCPASTIVHFQSVSLNEGIHRDELQLKELTQKMEAGGDQDPRLPELYQKVEQHLLAVRGRFDRNRSRFFSKWGQRIFRDDYRFIQADGLEERFFNHSKPQPLVSIIILTFNQLPYTIECVESILRHTTQPYELIFVDNGSTDGTVSWLRELSGKNSCSCTIIENGRNLGFAKGCNQGMETARGDYLLLLNNDVVVTQNWLPGMLACFDFRRDTGIVGPLTNNISGVQRLPGAPSTPQAGLDAFADSLRTGSANRRIYCRRIVGFCMLFSRELLNKVGYLDESFGNGNFEDDDYCLRAELEGFRNVIAGDVFIHHYGSVSFRGNNINYGSAMVGNKAVFNRKWSRTITEPVLARKVVTLKTIEEADRLRRQGKSNAAVDVLLKDGIAQIPGEIRFYRLIADIFLDAKMATEAFQTLEQAPDLNNDPEALFLLARAAGLLGQSGFVRTIQGLAEQCHPAYPNTCLVRGICAVHAGDPVGAADEFRKALSLDPANDAACFGLALAEEESANHRAAFSWYHRAFSIAPARLEAARGFHRMAGTPDEERTARNLLKEALHFREDDRDLRYLLIDLLIRNGETQEALSHAERAMVLFGADRGLVEAALSLRRSIGPLTVSPAARLEGTAVSLCMIAKNEAKSLPRCLASLKPVVDEIIVCDTGSSDLTREIAEAFGARVVEHAWNGDFSAARNRSLSEAAGSWILVMDADEVISAFDYEPFRALVQGSRKTPIAYTITTRNYTNKLVEKWQEHDGRYPLEEMGRGWMPSDKVRLFPNRPEIRFENALHEMVEASLDRLKIPYPTAERVIVHHYGYLDDDRQEAKKVLYYETGLRKLQETGGSPKAIVELAIQAAGIERYEEAIDLWQRALQYNQDSALVHFNLGYVNLCLGRYNAAYAATQRALELQHEYREAWANLALIEVLRGKHQAALDIIDSHSGAYADYVMFDLIRSVARCCSGDLEGATAGLRAVVERNIVFETFIETTERHLRQSGRGSDADAIVTAARNALAYPKN